MSSLIRLGRWAFGLNVLILVGCGHGGGPPATRLPAWALDANRGDRVRPKMGVRGRSESSDFVVAALQAAGLRFGTDGTVPSLWHYLRTSHRSVSPAAAQPGDVVLFRVSRATFADADACDTPDDVGIVAAVDDSGRIRFIEARNGHRQLGYVDPQHPRLRRDEGGQIRNSFLRSARVGDPVETPLLAGQMLCAVARPFG